MPGMNEDTALGPATRIVHHPYVPPAGFVAPQPGVFKASTVIFPNVAAMRSREWKDKSGYTYGLHGTPTTFTLEERLCALEGGLQCVLVPSGLAAIADVALALLQPGDEVLIPDNAYGPAKTWPTASWLASAFTMCCMTRSTPPIWQRASRRPRAWCGWRHLVR